jgi:hypothetical protein
VIVAEKRKRPKLSVMRTSVSLILTAAPPGTYCVEKSSPRWVELLASRSISGPKMKGLIETPRRRRVFGQLAGLLTAASNSDCDPEPGPL